MFQQKNYYLNELIKNEEITNFHYYLNQMISSFLIYDKIICNYKYHNTNFNIKQQYHHGLWLKNDLYELKQIKKYQFIIPGFLPFFQSTK